MKTMALEAESDALLQPPPPPPHPLPHYTEPRGQKQRWIAFRNVLSPSLSLSLSRRGRRKCEAILEISQQQIPFPTQKLIESGNSKRTLNKEIIPFIALLPENSAGQKFSENCQMITLTFLSDCLVLSVSV